MKNSPVVVIGAGLSGLCSARTLARHGIDVLILESQDSIGGRVRTDRIDGFLLDRGFQVLQTAYPEASAQLDYTALRLQSFEPGALIRTAGRMVEMGDPWRRPSKLLSTAFNGIGTFADRLRLFKLRWDATHTSDEALWNEPDSTTLEYLSASCGLSSDMIDRFFRPWFSGVFLEKDLATSSRFFRFLFRIFATGDAALPEQGMSAIPQQLAASLSPSMLRLSSPVQDIESSDRIVLATGESIACRAVVVAVEGPAASRLLRGRIPSPSSRSTSCLYYAADTAPFAESLLLLNGDQNGPINNMCVVSNVAKSYAPVGKSLVSVSVVGDMSVESAALEKRVRNQLRDWFGSQVDSWGFLKQYDILHALPVQPSGLNKDSVGSSRLADGIHYCGDYAATASIQGAMLSGRQAAEHVIADLARQRSN